MPVFDAFVDFENVLVTPACISGFPGPLLEIVLMAASPDHSIDAGATAESLTHGLMERAVVHGSAWLGGEAPIHWAAHVEVPVLSDEDIRFQIHLTGFQQQDLVFRILRQPACNN